MGLDAKAIGDLFGKDESKHRFIIPKYQRGYMWGETQIKELLNDIYTFSAQNDLNVYYLQPIVVQKKKDETNTYYLIDGQQRLTTMLLILRTLLKIDKDNITQIRQHEKRFYEISFDSKGRGKTRLENIVDECLAHGADPNAFYSDSNLAHIYEAVGTIKGWLEEKLDDLNEHEILQRFGKAITQCSNTKLAEKLVKIIWQEMQTDDKNSGDNYYAIKLFNKLNSGKIELTSSEVIKGYFIKGIKQDAQTEFALQWNEIEKKFQDDDFWYFLSNNIDKQTRTDILYEAIYEKEKNKEINKSKSESETRAEVLSFFEEKFGPDFNYGDYWRNTVYKAYDTLLYFYEDPVTYNLVGYLTGSENGTTLSNIYKKYEEKIGQGDDRSKFNHELRQMIKDKEKIDLNNISDYLYIDSGGKRKIKTILFLFNIEYYNERKEKFPFKKYHELQIELEHVGSQTDLGKNASANNDEKFFSIMIFKDRIEILKDIIMKKNAKDTDALQDRFVKIINNKDYNTLKNKAEKKEKLSKDEETLYGKMNDLVREYEEKMPDFTSQISNKHSVDNLVLLDKTTNTEYKNAPFYYKQYYILKNENGDDRFIPLPTRDLFLKRFSIVYRKEDDSSPDKDLSLYVWNEKSAQNYLEYIKKTLSAYK